MATVKEATTCGLASDVKQGEKGKGNKLSDKLIDRE